MLFLEQNDGTGGLDVEGRRSMLDGRLNDPLDAFVGDRGLVGQSIDRAAELSCLEEVVNGRSHGGAVLVVLSGAQAWKL